MSSIMSSIRCWSIIKFFFIARRWRMSDAQHCNAEWIVLNAVRCHSNRDVNIMKEKLLFSGQGEGE